MVNGSRTKGTGKMGEGQNPDAYWTDVAKSQGRNNEAVGGAQLTSSCSQRSNTGRSSAT
jgi:hypothetical protein